MIVFCPPILVLTLCNYIYSLMSQFSNLTVNTGFLTIYICFDIGKLLGFDQHFSYYVNCEIIRGCENIIKYVPRYKNRTIKSYICSCLHFHNQIILEYPYITCITILQFSLNINLTTYNISHYIYCLSCKIYKLHFCHSPT
jgi:hypothetical protein